jgi:hypothetical protein
MANRQPCYQPGSAILVTLARTNSKKGTCGRNTLFGPDLVQFDFNLTRASIVSAKDAVSNSGGIC